jgi:hypothetical protein
MVGAGCKGGLEAAPDLDPGSPTFRTSTQIRKVQGSRPDFGGNATIIQAWKRLPEFSAVWAYTPYMYRHPDHRDPALW